MLPVILPSKEDLHYLEPLFRRAVEIRKEGYTSPFTSFKNEEELEGIERIIDDYVDSLYSIDASDQCLD